MTLWGQTIGPRIPEAPDRGTTERFTRAGESPSSPSGLAAPPFFSMREWLTTEMESRYPPARKPSRGAFGVRDR
jgi:hypothetical protein